MSNFRRMHLIGGTLALALLILQSPKWWNSLNESFSEGAQLTASIAIGGYLLGCILGLLINLVYLVFRKESPGEDSR